MSAWAKVGAKCVCIREPNASQRLSGAAYPVKGQVYTVRDVRVVTFGKGAGDVCLLLEEIYNPAQLNAYLGRQSPLEPGMPVDAFRPLITRTQEEDLAIFRPLLETVGKDA